MVVRKFGDELTGPVGIRHGTQVVKNMVIDKEFVVDLLADIPAHMGGKKEAWASGKPDLGKDRECSSDIHQAILNFQIFWKALGVFRFPDGVCDPRGRTITQMKNIVAGLVFVDDPWRSIPPEGQFDATACWAASYCWWLKATPGARERSQVEIFSLGAGRAGTTNPDGTVNLLGCMSFLQSQHSDLFAKNMTVAELKPALQMSRLPVNPIIIGFATGPMGGHMNVLHSYNRTTDELVVMEPWFPDPELDPNFAKMTTGGATNYFHKRTGAPFKFKGTHVKRPLSYYTSRPMNGRILIFPDPARLGIPIPFPIPDVPVF